MLIYYSLLLKEVPRCAVKEGIVTDMGKTTIVKAEMDIKK